jgi:hypothetical protein
MVISFFGVRGACGSYSSSWAGAAVANPPRGAGPERGNQEESGLTEWGAVFGGLILLLRSRERPVERPARHLEMRCNDVTLFPTANELLRERDVIRGKLEATVRRSYWAQRFRSPHRAEPPPVAQGHMPALEVGKRADDWDLGRPSIEVDCLRQRAYPDTAFHQIVENLDEMRRRASEKLDALDHQQVALLACRERLPEAEACSHGTTRAILEDRAATCSTKLSPLQR